MGTHSKGAVVGTGPKAIEVSEDVARLLELRREGMNLKEAAEICGIPYGTAQSWIRKYIRHVSSKAVIAFRDQELTTLERAQERVLQALFATNYQFYQGVMVTTPHPQGLQEQDPVTGQWGPVRVPVVDHEPNVRAAAALIKVMERKSRLLGADRAPDRSTAPEGSGTDAPGNDPARTSQLTPAVMEELLRRLAQKAGVRLDNDAAVDVVPRTLDPLVSEASGE